MNVRRRQMARELHLEAALDLERDTDEVQRLRAELQQDGIHRDLTGGQLQNLRHDVAHGLGNRGELLAVLTTSLTRRSHIVLPLNAHRADPTASRTEPTRRSGSATMSAIAPFTSLNIAAIPRGEQASFA